MSRVEITTYKYKDSSPDDYGATGSSDDGIEMDDDERVVVC